jgi:small subunit ribosomal protein S15
VPGSCIEYIPNLVWFFHSSAYLAAISFPENLKIRIFPLPLQPKLAEYYLDDLKKIEMPYLTKEKKANFFSDFGGKSINTGSIEGQIALLTERINNISQHLKANKKDFSTNRGLMQMVGKRKRLLTYLSKHNLQGYRQLIEKLGLRK